MSSGHSRKSVWLCIFLITIFKGNYSLNLTQTEELEAVVNKTITETCEESTENTDTTTIQSESTGVNTSELTETSVRSITLGQPGNGSLKTNFSLVAEAVEALDPEAPFRLPKSAAIGAGIFLVSAVFGYLSCVSYRRFLQRKYGNSQILNAEEVYDTSDLRYFEI